MNDALLRELGAPAHLTTYIDTLRMAQELYRRVTEAAVPGIPVKQAVAYLRDNSLWFFQRGQALHYDYARYVELRADGWPRCEQCGSLEFNVCDTVPRVYRDIELQADGTLLVNSEDGEMCWDGCYDEQAICCACGSKLDIEYEFS